LLGDERGRGAVDGRRRLRERGLDRGAVEPDHVGRAFVGVEIQSLAVGLGVEDMAEQEALERRDVGNRDRRLDDGRCEIVGHGVDLREQ
jgi:hypothetical protein